MQQIHWIKPGKALIMIICEDELISCLNLKLLMGGGSDISFSLQYVDVKQILFYVERTVLLWRHDGFHQGLNLDRLNSSQAHTRDLTVSLLLLLLLLNKSKSHKAKGKLLLQLQFIAETIIRIFEPLYEENGDVYSCREKQLWNSLWGDLSMDYMMSYNFMGKGLMLCYRVL